MSKKLGAAHILACVLLAATTSCGGDKSPAEVDSGTTPPSTAGGDRVLFVGNSLTEGNDLPLIVEALSRAGGRPFAVEAVTYGGFSLEDHWGRGADRIAGGGYRFVVLQRGAALAENVNLRSGRGASTR